jgi:tripartite-type tricarboxylate transporter receptor subunit TctC
MKKICIMMVALMITIVMALSGCSSKTAETQTANESSAASQTETAASAPEAITDFPTDPIKVVVPFGAGGGTDLIARILADKMSKVLDVAVEVVNMPGGSATIGTTEVANANPDGYTLGFCISTPIAITPNLGQTSYTVDDLQAICNAYMSMHTICVPADSPIQNVDDLIKYIDDQGGNVSYAGSGTGNMQHLCMEEWVNQLGKDWNLTVVPYDGDNDEALALLSGEAPFATLQSHGVKSYIESGQLRCILVFGDTTPQWMIDEGYDVPNTVSLGYLSWITGPVGFFGPAGLSDDVVQIISDAVKASLEDEEVIESLANLGLEPNYRDTEKYKKMLDELAPASKQMMLELGFIQ